MKKVNHFGINLQSVYASSRAEALKLFRDFINGLTETDVRELGFGWIWSDGEVRDSPEPPTGYCGECWVSFYNGNSDYNHDAVVAYVSFPIAQTEEEESAILACLPRLTHLSGGVQVSEDKWAALKATPNILIFDSKKEIWVKGPDFVHS